MESGSDLLEKGLKAKDSCDSCCKPYKYRCPACDAKSCSLDCVKMHKTRTNCGGSYLSKHISREIKITQYTESDLRRDRDFLQQMERRILGHGNDSEKESVGPAGKRCSTDSVLKEGGRCKRQTPIPLLKKACNKRNIRISFCPVSGMQIRRQNTTYYDKKSDRLYWKVEFSVFIDTSIDGDGCALPYKQFHIDNVSEDEVVSERLNKVIGEGTSLTSVVRIYHVNGSNSHEGDELDLNRTFRENLSGKKVIEFPKIKVVVGG